MSSSNRPPSSSCPTQQEEDLEIWPDVLEDNYYSYYAIEDIEPPKIKSEKNCLAELKQQMDCIGVILEFICPFKRVYSLSLVCKDWSEIIKKLECKIEFESSFHSPQLVPYHKFYKSKFFNNVKELRMYGRNSGIVNKVINSPKNRMLEKLELEYASPKSAIFISKSENVAMLTSLKFHNSRILNLGAIRIVECEKLSNLTELHLPRCKVNVIFVAKLASSKHMSKLRELNLETNNLRAEGVKLLANSPNLANLTSLNLTRNQIGKDGAMYLSKSQYLTQLAKLDLNGNIIGDEGLSYICANMSNLTNLNLSGNLISDEGIQIIAKCEKFTNLRHLFLANNTGCKLVGIKEVENTYSSSAKSILSKNSPYLKNLVTVQLKSIYYKIY